MTENEIARAVVDASVEVHRVLGGPGLLESIYEDALVYELESRGLEVQRQVKVPIRYKGKRSSCSHVGTQIQQLQIRRRNPIVLAEPTSELQGAQCSRVRKLI